MLLKPRRPKTPLLAIGEGKTEGAFLNHLTSLYNARYSGLGITVDWTDGGSPVDIVNYSIKKKDIAAYDYCFLLMDSDLPCAEETRNEAEQSSIRIIESKPCVEGLMLSILDNSCVWGTRNASFILDS